MGLGDPSNASVTASTATHVILLFLNPLERGITTSHTSIYDGKEFAVWLNKIKMCIYYSDPDFVHIS